MKLGSAQKQINIKEVKDGILVLPGNKYRMILLTSSINFELKSSVEQDAIIESFQHFLNSLPCKVQILVRVRELEIENYLENIVNESASEKSKVYKDQLKNYGSFIRQLVSGNKIMTRAFYIVIPLSADSEKKDFEIVKSQLKLNADIISKGLESLGMKSRPLDNLEVLQMFYGVYNPSLTKSQPLNALSFKELLSHANII